MHMPTFGQVATLGMAFFAVAALANPVAEPLEADIVERSADIVARGEGIAAIGGAEVLARNAALEQRNKKKKCKRTHSKDYCSDSDDDKKKKDNKKKQCKRNKKGDCSDSDDDKKKGNQKGNQKDDKKGGNKGYYRRHANADVEDLE
ncbi:hypothetical protein CkaCkLH20_12532 [Colletotrichum karsti]|uniref:Uncharacterized protein n=1 Tax=Colletotrichum karsti TaxID=1095194 RepID=A0A9P6LE32_9PEZI|nr:uncharacterized protein CkaCkLH20_12532 [Colletotrichum karsti]KAF9869923.1 hypothetical protein CkaCkLH20_12532 [Colletotrichum karsti]